MSAGRRRALPLGIAAAAALGMAVAAWAFFTATGSGSASASVGTLNAATISAPSTSNGATTITWTQQASVSAAQNASITYVVERKLGAGSYAAIGSGGCSGSLPYGTTSCTDTVAVSGSYTYRVVAHFSSWTATSNEAGPVVTNTDTTPPTVQMIVLHDASPTKASSVQFDVVFSEPVTGVDATDFALAASGVTGASITSVTGSGAGYSVLVNTGVGSGSLGLNVADDDSIADLAGNPLGGPGTIGAGSGSFTGATYAIDRTAPAVQSVNRSDPSPTSAGTVHWSVTFSESVGGVDAADFALAATGVIGASISSVTGSGATYTVTASTGTGSGSLGLNVVDDDSIADALGNLLGGAGAGNGSFNGQLYAIDRGAPSVTVEQKAGQSDPTNTAPMVWTVTFSESVTGLSASDLVRGGTTTGGTVTVTGSGATYEISLAGSPTNGTTTFSVPAGAAQDAGGNLNTASTSTDNTITYDTVAPALTLTTPADGSGTNSATPAISGAAGNATGDSTTIAVRIYTGASATGPGIQNFNVTRSGASWSASAAALTQGTYTVRATQTDAAGNTGTSAANTFVVDTTAPTVTVNQKTGQADPASTLPILWTVTFSEPVSGFDASDLTRGGTSTGGTATVAGSGASYEISLSGAVTQGSTTTFSIASGRAQDVAGNQNVASTSTDNTVTYQAAPTLTSLQMLDVNANGKVDRVVATFDETLANSAATAPWTLANVPSGGTLASVSTSGSAATLVLNEGAGAADTAVGSFTVALAATATGIRDTSGTQSSFAATAPSDGAGPVLMTVSAGAGSTAGLMEPGDTIVMTFSEALDASTVSANYAVSEARSGGSTSLSIQSLINNASINQSYLGGNNSSGTANLSPSALTLANTRITVTVGAILTSGNGLGAGTGAVTIVPSNVLRDPAGNGAAATSQSLTRLF